MDTFLMRHHDVIKRVFYRVAQHDKSLKSLSTWWEKIALVGKINSFEVASTILEDMDTTLHQFKSLQTRLVESLLNEHASKVIFQNSSRSQIAIDVLIRNLFERTADIGFLATDFDIINFLEKDQVSESDREFIEQRLAAYCQIYSVYQDAILIKPDGELLFQLSQPTRTGQISDDIIQQALNNPDDYVEFFGQTSLFENSEPNLLYASAVTGDSGVVGVIVLCFRFVNELDGITDSLLSDDEENHFLLCDGFGKLLYAPRFSSTMNASAPKLNIKETPNILSVDNASMLQVVTKGHPYQDYLGPENWHFGSLLPIEQMEEDHESESPEMINRLISSAGFNGLISEDLLKIREQSVAINDDLQLIVLNGIITSARNEAVEFMPVLEAIKKIGLDISAVFDKSIESLFSIIVSGKLNEMRLQASLAVDIMDRNLYERANDCRWWGLNSQLRQALSKPEADAEVIKEILATIHELYTVYHVLYVYDKQGRYIAFSNDQYNDRLGQSIEGQSGAQGVSQLNSIYQYTVSDFDAFDCYEGDSTYIYNAAIRDMEDDKRVIGGIGIVFDSTVEFSAILNDVLPQDNGQIKEGSKALFTTDKGVILSTTSGDYVVGDTFLPEIDKEQLDRDGSLATLMELDGKHYLLSVAKSKGYREYKREDGYENTVLAWLFTPC